MESDFGIAVGRKLIPLTNAKTAGSAGKLSDAISSLDSELKGLIELVVSLEQKLAPLMVSSEPSDTPKRIETEDNSSDLVRGLRDQRSTVLEIRAKVLSIYERTEI